MNGRVENLKKSESVRSVKVRIGIKNVKRKKNDLTQHELISILDYNPLTGVFTRKHDRGSFFSVGDVAGFIERKGYICLSVCGVYYKAHRLAWLFMEGYWPEHQIDHINGVRSDNRFKNLRHVTQSCNLQNQKTRADNTSGFFGVSWNTSRSKWISQAQINGVKKYLGIYSDPLEAALARFTFEQQCNKWNCNNRLELVREIKAVWPEFAGV